MRRIKQKKTNKQRDEQNEENKKLEKDQDRKQNGLKKEGTKW